jgi:two-component system, chemotaxis family, response regulator PixG
MSSIEFSARKQAELFEILKQRQFSGRLLLSGAEKQQWSLYLSSGRIIYAAGGIHPVRRWQRNLAKATPHLPEIPDRDSSWQSSLQKAAPESLRLGWEYQLLCYWVDRQEITVEEATKAIWFSLVEVLFDLNRIGQVSSKLEEDRQLSTRLVAIEAAGAIAQAEKLWLAWQAANATPYSPHLALTIAQPDKLQQQFSVEQCQKLARLANGERSLQDLSVRLNRDVVTIARLFVPYVQSELLEMVEIDDLPPPIAINVDFPPTQTPTGDSGERSQPLIACVDDSPLICYIMETIIKKTNCRFLAINDSSKAVEILSECQPDLIFLDLIMPKLGGYEVCTLLRRRSEFRRTPIVILTGNDGIVDRVKAKLVGSSGFINKPVKPEIVLGVVRKHLKAVLTSDPDSEIRYRGRPLKLN